MMGEPLPPLDYERVTPRDLSRAARRLANASLACAAASGLLICVSVAGDQAFNAVVPNGQDSDQFDPTLLLNFLHGLAELAPLSFLTLLAGAIFAIVGLTQRRTPRVWLALAANLAPPAAISIAAM